MPDLNDTVIAALVSGVLLLVGTLLTLRVKSNERKALSDDRRSTDQATFLASQLTGWDTFSKALRARITELEADAERCNRRVAEQNVTIDGMREEISELRRDVAQLRYDAQHKPG